MARYLTSGKREKLPTNIDTLMFCTSVVFYLQAAGHASALRHQRAKVEKSVWRIANMDI